MHIVSVAISGTRIVKEGNEVSKFTTDEDYMPRIIAQAEKQKNMRKLFQEYGIQVPRITSINNHGFRMEYIPGTGFINFIETSPVEEVRNLFSRLVTFVESNLQIATYTRKLDRDLVFLETKKKNFPKEYISLAELFSGIEPAPLPVAPCHGDMTFSNLLFYRSNMYIIDFNDTPIISPILDIIKIRQDTKYHWTSMMSSRRHDTIKIKVFYTWMNAFLDSMLLRRKIYMADYRYWEALNYFRILRNAKTKELREWLANRVSEVLYGK